MTMSRSGAVRGGTVTMVKTAAWSDEFNRYLQEDPPKGLVQTSEHQIYWNGERSTKYNSEYGPRERQQSVSHLSEKIPKG